MKSVEVFKQYIWNWCCPLCRRWNYFEQTIFEGEEVTCDCGEKYNVKEVSDI